MKEVIQNAQIDRTFFGIEDHGILTFFIHLQYDECGYQGFGGYSLDGHGEGWGKWLLFVRALLRALEIEKWEELPGCYCRVKREDGSMHAKPFAIGHPIKDKWADIRDYLPEQEGEDENV